MFSVLLVWVGGHACTSSLLVFAVLSSLFTNVIKVFFFPTIEQIEEIDLTTIVEKSMDTSPPPSDNSDDEEVSVRDWDTGFCLGT
jgi:hypothetical protein